MNDSKLVEQTEESLRQAIDDYFCHTSQDFVRDDISENFIARLARDSVRAKTELRELFRQSRVWDENLQALVINGTKTHDPDYAQIHRLAYKVIDSAHRTFGDQYLLIQRAIRFFDNSDREGGIDAIKILAPNAYRPNRKKSRVFKSLCDAIGVTDETSGSEFQYYFAQLADELNSKKIDFKLFVSINPAHFLTMSNPKNDARGTTMPSCHSFNATDLPYNVGCTGYARDRVTTIAFTVDNPDKPELLNNRKTTRQLFMYRVGGGLLLQSRMYNTSGGTSGAQKDSALYRDLVQREISELEGAVNLWTTKKYCGNSWGICLDKGCGFGGYEDWVYPEFDARISIRADHIDDYETFRIGTYGLCVVCGDEISKGLYCEECDHEKHIRCEHCGERCSETWTVYDRYGHEIEVCEDCLEDSYTRCADCGEWHCTNDMHLVSDDRLVCDNCFESDYTCCDECGEYYHNDDECLRLAYDCNGNEVYICECCYDSEYETCAHCDETYHESLMNTFCDKDGDEIRVCGDCLEKLEDEAAE